MADNAGSPLDITELEDDAPWGIAKHEECPYDLTEA